MLKNTKSNPVPKSNGVKKALNEMFLTLFLN